MNDDLPLIEFDLTPTEKDRCNDYSAWLKRIRNKANDLEIERALNRLPLNSPATDTGD